MTAEAGVEAPVAAEKVVMPEDAGQRETHAGDTEDLDFMQQNGYVVVKSALDASVCDELRTHVWAVTDEAAKQGRNDLFGNIQESENRWDLKLELCRPVVTALNQFSARCGKLLVGFMGSPSVKVVELAAITSAPGAKAQPVHADTMHGVTRFLQSDVDLPTGPQASEGASDDEDAAEDLGQIVRAVATETAIICSALVALQDVEEDMGPTHVWPGTNTVEHHATLWGTGVGGKLDIPTADASFGIPHRKMTLKKGDLVLYDSRTMHCGGANESQGQRRSVLVISTMGAGIRPDGTTWSMLPALRNRLRLHDFPMEVSETAAPTCAPGSVVLPPPSATAKSGRARDGVDDDPAEGKPIPALEDWAAAVQCATCRQWRPCSAEDAPRFAGAERGFFCKAVGFVCSQPQKYSQEQIDEALG